MILTFVFGICFLKGKISRLSSQRDYRVVHHKRSFRAWKLSKISKVEGNEIDEKNARFKFYFTWITKLLLPDYHHFHHFLEFQLFITKHVNLVYGKFFSKGKRGVWLMTSYELWTWNMLSIFPILSQRLRISRSRRHEMLFNWTESMNFSPFSRFFYKKLLFSRISSIN